MKRTYGKEENDNSKFTWFCPECEQWIQTFHWHELQPCPTNKNDPHILVLKGKPKETSPSLKRKEQTISKKY